MVTSCVKPPVVANMMDVKKACSTSWTLCPIGPALDFHAVCSLLREMIN